jgi:hypothetical protein
MRAANLGVETGSIPVSTTNFIGVDRIEKRDLQKHLAVLLLVRSLI